ncbi:MAG: glycosyltransferase family 2 protein [Thermoplasmataceae archaeon]
MEQGTLSIIIPTMNEEKTIGQVIDSLSYLSPKEIIVVDTNSKDKTREIAREKGAVVIEEPRRGYGVAYKTGIPRSTGELVLCLDGDGTYPSDIVGTLIELLRINDVDFISCDRMTLRNQNSYTNLHYIGNSVLNLSIFLLYGFHVVDSQSGMWLFRREIYNKMVRLSDGMSFSQDIKIEALIHGTLIEVPIRYGLRITKPKLNTWHDGFANLFAIFTSMVNRR